MIAAEKFPHNDQPNFNHTDSTALHSNSPPTINIRINNAPNVPRPGW